VGATYAWRRILPPLLAALAAIALAAGPAHAQPGPPEPDVSGVEQYRELVPGASGPTAPGVGDSGRTPLTPAGAAALEDAPPDVAAALEEVATSSEYGAPTSADGPATGDEGVATDGSAFSDFGSATDARVLAALFAVLGLTVAAVALALHRRGAG
jgi:hypothetical protein